MPCETGHENTLSLKATLISLNENYPRKKTTRTPPPRPTIQNSSSPTNISFTMPIPPSKPKKKPKKTDISTSEKSKPKRKLRSTSVPNPSVSERVTDLNESSDNRKDGFAKVPFNDENIKLPNLSPNASSNRQHDREGKKVRRPALLVAIRPENSEAEKDKFIKSSFLYNPQLTYKCPPSGAVLTRFSVASSSLMPVAEKILQNVITRYDTFEKFVDRTAGKKLNRCQILDSAKQYLRQEGLVNEVSVSLTDNILARACMTRVRGQPTLQVRTRDIRELWMGGIMRHEIGTHYMRSCNNRQQSWCRWKKRKEMGLGPINPTEEGLASLHSILYYREPALFRSALLYYTVYQASRLSFCDLFRDLGRFVKDPDVRWDFCMRAKRGQEDTELPGSFCKDQVYLRGAVEILKHRNSIDFHALVQCGKVDYKDIERLKEHADLENTRVPGFMTDLDLYRAKLDHVMVWNGLTDQDLDAV